MVERDSYPKGLFDEMKGGDLHRLREIFGRFVSSTRLPGFEATLKHGDNVARILKLQDNKMMEFFDRDPTFLGNTLGLAAEHQAMEAASTQAKKNLDLRILFSSGVLNTRAGRDASLRFFPSQGIVPNILIIRAQLHQLMAAVEQRKRETLDDEHCNDHNPVHPSEAWHSVTVLDNKRLKDPSELAASIRRGLLNCTENTLTRPIEFTIPSV